MHTFDSKYLRLAPVNLPAFEGDCIMMMPVQLGGILPKFLNRWQNLFTQLCELATIKQGVGYLTIHEKTVEPKQTHRRGGLHVDGVFNGGIGPWGGGGGGWGPAGGGMLTVSNVSGCRAWNQDSITGTIGNDGEADHFAPQLKDSNSEIFEPEVAYWLDGLCIHESMPQPETVDRQFIRLSMPSESPWFEGYTENPDGVMPTGPILPKRQYMQETI